MLGHNGRQLDDIAQLDSGKRLLHVRGRGGLGYVESSGGTRDSRREERLQGIYQELCHRQLGLSVLLIVGASREVGQSPGG